MDWNVVVTVKDDFDRARSELRTLGPVSRTEYFNVLVMEVEDIEAFLDDLRDLGRMIPDLLDECLARVEPAQHAFRFRSGEEFEEKARGVVRALAPRLAGRSFYVRMHRRGFGDQLSSGEEERELAGVVYDALEERGAAEPSVSFDDPEAVLAVETVSDRAGVSLWTRDDLAAYPFLDPG